MDNNLPDKKDLINQLLKTKAEIIAEIEKIEKLITLEKLELSKISCESFGYEE